MELKSKFISLELRCLLKVKIKLKTKKPVNIKRKKEKTWEEINSYRLRKLGCIKEIR